jgi:hypothetical protein
VVEGQVSPDEGDEDVDDEEDWSPH